MFNKLLVYKNLRQKVFQKMPYYFEIDQFIKYLLYILKDYELVVAKRSTDLCVYLEFSEHLKITCAVFSLPDKSQLNSLNIKLLKKS